MCGAGWLWEVQVGINVGFIYDPEPNVKGAHPESDIRLVADNVDELDALARKSRVRTLSSLGLADDPEAVDPEGLEMLDPQEGIRTLEAILAKLSKDPDKNPEMDYPELLVEELEELRQCLEQAASKKVRFRFALEL